MSTDIRKVFLLPGEYMVSKRAHRISTLLGSCVSVCLYSPKLKFGGMNHYMLVNSASGDRNGKYGDYAINVLIQFMERACGSLDGVEAMIFGGANVVSTITSGAGAQIGERNIIYAREMMKKHGIRVTREEVGGTVGLKIHYQNWDNDVKVEPMTSQKMSGSLITKAESSRMQSIPRPGSGSMIKASSPTQIASRPVVGRRIKVLIVDDSAIVRNLLFKAMSGEPELEVVGQACDAFEARTMLLELGPDVITLDIIMPKMDGVTFLKQLMVYHPIPVIICSSIAKSGSRAEFRADKIGAVDVIDKESLNLSHGMEKIREVLIPKIKAAAKMMVFKKSKEEVSSIS